MPDSTWNEREREREMHRHHRHRCRHHRHRWLFLMLSLDWWICDLQTPKIRSPVSQQACPHPQAWISQSPLGSHVALILLPTLSDGISARALASSCLQGPACPFHLKPAAPPRLPWTPVLGSTAGFLQATEDRTQTRSQSNIYVCSWTKCQECEKLQTGSYERKGNRHDFPIKTFRKEKVTTKVPMQGKQIIFFQDIICKFTLLHKGVKIENKSFIVSSYLI